MIFICYSKCVFILIDVVLWGLLFKFFFNNKNVFCVLLEICVGNGYSLINFKFLEKKEIKFLWDVLDEMFFLSIILIIFILLGYVCIKWVL